MKERPILMSEDAATGDGAGRAEQEWRSLWRCHDCKAIIFTNDDAGVCFQCGGHNARVFFGPWCVQCGEKRHWITRLLSLHLCKPSNATPTHPTP